MEIKHDLSYLDKFMSDSEISQRLRAIREFTGLSRERFANLLGVGMSSWQKYEDNLAFPGGNVLLSLCEKGYSADWVLTGNGSMLLKDVKGTFPFDAALLAQIVAEVDDALKSQKPKISDSRRSKLYGLIYEEVMNQRMEDGARGNAKTTLDTDKIARLVKLAM